MVGKTKNVHGVGMMRWKGNIMKGFAQRNYRNSTQDYKNTNAGRMNKATLAVSNAVTDGQGGAYCV